MNLIIGNEEQNTTFNLKSISYDDWVSHFSARTQTLHASEEARNRQWVMSVIQVFEINSCRLVLLKRSSIYSKSSNFISCCIGISMWKNSFCRRKTVFIVQGTTPLLFQGGLYRPRPVFFEDTPPKESTSRTRLQITILESFEIFIM